MQNEEMIEIRESLRPTYLDQGRQPWNEGFKACYNWLIPEIEKLKLELERLRHHENDLVLDYKLMENYALKALNNHIETIDEIIGDEK